MSAQAWGSVDGGSLIVHACPDCQEKHQDWQEQLERLAHESS